MKKLFTTFFTLIFILLSGKSVFALTLTSTQSGNWSSTTTWGGISVPGAGDVVIINGGFNITVDVSNAVCLSLQLGGSAVGSGDGTLTFSASSHLSVSGLVTLGVGNRKANMTMVSGGILSCEGFVMNSLGTWTPGTGTIEFTASNVLPNNGLTSFTNITMSGGTTTLAANISVTGNLLINSAGELNGATNQLTIGGNWTNNGTFTGNTGLVIFNKNGNQSIAGTGFNNFNLIKLNMGTSNANILEVLATNFSVPDPFLTLSGGTFKVSGTFPLTNSFILGPIYNIQPVDGIWINNPNVTVSAQAGGISVRGLLRISAGTYNVGTSTDHNLDYVAGASIIVEGGALNVAGHFGRNNATSSISYNQSGGIVTVVKQGSTDLVFAGFDIGAPASSFTMSGGTIVVSNSTSAPADFLNSASAVTVTGGILQIGDANSLNAQTIRIQSSASIGNLLVSNATSQATKPTAKLITSSLNVLGGITMQSGTTLDANGLNITLGGDWSNSGTFIPGPLVTFNGTGAQGLTKAGTETFNGLTINKTGSTLTFNNSAIVNAAFSLTQGTIAVGNNTLTLNGSVSGGGNLTSATTGTVNYNQGIAGQNVLAASYGYLVFSNFNKTLASTGIIGISGVFTAGTATGHTVTGSTIDFNGGVQTIPTFAYNNLTLSGSGTKTGTGTLTVGGNLMNNTGIVFTGTTLLNLNGNSHTNNGTLSAATIIIGPGATYTNNGTTTANTSLTGTGTLTQTGTGILNIGGTIDITTLNAAVTGNTVNYTGVSQAVRTAPYYHLTLSGSGTPTLAGVTTINGDFTLSGTVTPIAASGLTIGGNFNIGTGTSFGAGSFSHSVAGNFSNTGTFIAGTSTLTLNGISLQTLSSTTFYNLTINNAAGVTMGGEVTLSNTLTLTNGGLSIGAHTLTINGAITTVNGSLTGGTTSNILVGGSGASTFLPSLTLNNLTLNRGNGVSLGGNATINGTLTITNGILTTGAQTITLASTATLSEAAGQTVLGNITTTRGITSTTGTVTFGNIGVDITLNGTAPGNTTVLRKTGIASTGAGHSSIKRYFDITPTINTGLNSGIVFHYDLTEINSQNPNLFELYRSRDAGTTWNNLGGIVNTSAQTVTVSGINDLSRWTVADTNNRIGNSATPTLTSISPTFKNIGDPAFTMTVNGTEFVNGKSTVRFNGSNRITTYVNSTQLTAAIPSSDLLVAGNFPVTVFNINGGGQSNSQTFTVNANAPVSISVETAPNGTGTLVSAQSLASGSSITLYAITRDASNNFVANVAASTWITENITGGIVAGDLVPAVDSKSAVFTAHLIGATDIKATSGSLTAIPSGLITVIPSVATSVRVETAANGSGTIIPAQTLASGVSLTLYAITRDALNNFISNVNASAWTIENITGGIVAGDLVAAADNKSAVFTGHIPGTADIKATSGALNPIPTGMITVIPGTATTVRVETAANGTGTIVPAQTLISGSSITVYSISRDASNNFISNIAASSWTLENISGGLVQSDLIPSADNKSAVFTGHSVGNANIKASSGSLTASPSGIITVTPGAATSIRVETEANGSGTVVPIQLLTSGSSLTVYSVTRDAFNNFLANVAATNWTLENLTGGVVAGDLVPAGDSKSAVFTGHLIGSANVKATSGGLNTITSGTITIVPAGTPVIVRVETAADGTGTIVPAQALTSGSSLAVYAISRDGANNFIANVAASQWSVENINGGIAASDLVPSVDNKSAVFTGHVTGTANIKATSGVLTAIPSGLITVIPGIASKIRVENAPDGSGIVVPAQLLTSGTSLTVYSITRDASDNFVANVAATSWSLQSITGGIVQTDLIPSTDLKNAIFTGHTNGSAVIKAMFGSVETITSGIITVESATGLNEAEIMPVFELYQNYPNPFNNNTTISWELPIGCHITLQVFNMLGKEVKTLANEYQDEGKHSMLFEADPSLPDGIYFIRLQAGKYSDAKKMNLFNGTNN